MITRKAKELIICGGFSGLLLILHIFDVPFTNICGFFYQFYDRLKIVFRKIKSHVVWKSWRARLLQKVKRSERNCACVTFASEALQVFFALDDFALYILPCSNKENTVKETFTKLKLKAPWWFCHIYTSNNIYTSNHIYIPTIFILPTIFLPRIILPNRRCGIMLRYVEGFLRSLYKHCWQNFF